jgi:hypothetical protein
MIIAMTLTKKGLRKLGENARVLFTPEQEKIILERFGAEPWPHEWTGQDIACQIDTYLTCGLFEKPVKNHNTQLTLPEETF